MTHPVPPETLIGINAVGSPERTPQLHLHPSSYSLPSMSSSATCTGSTVVDSNMRLALLEMYVQQFLESAEAVLSSLKDTFGASWRGGGASTNNLMGLSFGLQMQQAHSVTSSFQASLRAVDSGAVPPTQPKSFRTAGGAPHTSEPQGERRLTAVIIAEGENESNEPVVGGASRSGPCKEKSPGEAEGRCPSPQAAPLEKVLTLCNTTLSVDEVIRSLYTLVEELRRNWATISQGSAGRHHPHAAAGNPGSSVPQYGSTLLLPMTTNNNSSNSRSLFSGFDPSNSSIMQALGSGVGSATIHPGGVSKLFVPITFASVTSDPGGAPGGRHAAVDPKYFAPSRGLADKQYAPNERQKHLIMTTDGVQHLPTGNGGHKRNLLSSSMLASIQQQGMVWPSMLANLAVAAVAGGSDTTAPPSTESPVPVAQGSSSQSVAASHVMAMYMNSVAMLRDAANYSTTLSPGEYGPNNSCEDHELDAILHGVTSASPIATASLNAERVIIDKGDTIIESQAEGASPLGASLHMAEAARLLRSAASVLEGRVQPMVRLTAQNATAVMPHPRALMSDSIEPIGEALGGGGLFKSSFINDYAILPAPVSVDPSMKLALCRGKNRIVMIKTFDCQSVHHSVGGDVAAGHRNDVLLLTSRNGRKRDISLALLQREIAVMKKLRHKNIVSLYEVIDDPEAEKLYLVMQYVDGDPISTKLVVGNPERSAFDFDTLLRSADCVLGALECLHQNGVAHGDISPDNIIIPRSSDGEAMLLPNCDGAHELGDDRTTTTAAAAADMWSFGVTFVALLSGNVISQHSAFSLLLNHSNATTGVEKHAAEDIIAKFCKMNCNDDDDDVKMRFLAFLFDSILSRDAANRLTAAQARAQLRSSIMTLRGVAQLSEGDAQCDGNNNGTVSVTDQDVDAAISRVAYGRDETGSMEGNLFNGSTHNDSLAHPLIPSIPPPVPASSVYNRTTAQRFYRIT